MKESSVGSKKVLVAIVDDHVQTAVAISQILEFNGFRTFQAYNIEEAIQKIKSENPDLAIIEFMLDGESGVDLAKKFPKLKVIFLTGSELTESDLKGVRKLVGIVKKPISNDEILELVRKEFEIKG
ncbi:Response regulator receiver domain protein [uncultured archaeon]|nr:Response regulator receiver domain protein [uncultured archaeon]